MGAKFIPDDFYLWLSKLINEYDTLIEENKVHREEWHFINWLRVIRNKYEEKLTVDWLKANASKKENNE